MKRTHYLILIGLFLLLGGFFLFENKTPSSSHKTTVGIIVPMEHEALRQIVKGFEEDLRKSYHGEVDIKVCNAQGDINLQRAMISQLVNDKADLIVPIGMAATQMTLNMAKNQKVVFLAAMYSQKTNLISGVQDEIPVALQIDFMHQLMPNVKKISLIYSNSEKIFPEVEELVKHCKEAHIEVQPLMIQNLSDLYTMSRMIAEDSELIFTFKDHMVVSGISTLAHIAQQRGIPIMTSDEGSVKEGGAFALGVREADIGRQGGRLAAKVLSGTPLSELPIEVIDSVCIFINTDACRAQRINVADVEQAAAAQHYPVVIFGNKE